MRFGPGCGLRMASGAFLLIHLGIWNCMAYLDREPRLKQVSLWKRLLPWLNPPTAKLEPKQPFFVVWNSPTFRCGRRYGLPMDLKKFGIVGNDLELFHGDVINLFYESRLGLYPRILKNGISFNGGIPQLANFTAHFEWVKADLDWYIPNKTYDGLAVIDWEAWKPLFEQNRGEKRRYALRALAVVQSRHPWWRGTHVYWKTQQEFDKAAKRLMDETNALCQRLRPNAKWGFYMFPTCYNSRPGQNYCKKSTIDQNDKMSWLYRNSKALYPSLYLKSQQHPELQRLYVEGALRETYRVIKRHCNRDALVIPYARYSYPNSREFYTKSDLESSIGQAADSGAAGIVLWESYKNIQHKTDCKNTHKYLHTILGPFVKDVLKFTQKCSEHLCGGHGRCISRQWSTYGLVSTKPHKHGSQHRRGKRSTNNNVDKLTAREFNTLPSSLDIDGNPRSISEGKGVGEFSAINASVVRKMNNEKALENIVTESLWREGLNVSKKDPNATVEHLSLLNRSSLHEISKEQYFDTEGIFDLSIDKTEQQHSATGPSTSHQLVSIGVEPSITTHSLYSLEKNEYMSNIEYQDENPILGTKMLDRTFGRVAQLISLENEVKKEGVTRSILLTSRESSTRNDPLISDSLAHIETLHSLNTITHTDTLSITPNSAELSADLQPSYHDMSGSFLKSTSNKEFYASNAPTISLSTSDMYPMSRFSNTVSLLAKSNSGADSRKEVEFSTADPPPLLFTSTALGSTNVLPSITSNSPKETVEFSTADPPPLLFSSTDLGSTNVLPTYSINSPTDTGALFRTNADIQVPSINPLHSRSTSYLTYPIDNIKVGDILISTSRDAVSTSSFFTPNWEYSSVFDTMPMEISQRHTDDIFNTEINAKFSSVSIDIRSEKILSSKHGTREINPVEDKVLPSETEGNVPRNIIKIRPSKPTTTPILLEKRAARKRANRRRRRRKGKKVRKRRPMENETVERKHIKRKKVNIRQQFSNYVCRCYDGWTGEFCQHKFYPWQ